MTMSSQHPSYLGQASRAAARLPQQAVAAAEPAAVYRPARRHCQRACCCPAMPAVIAVIPAQDQRRAPADLLLCGHHYRVSRSALTAAGATILDLHGYPLTSGDWPEPAR